MKLGIVITTYYREDGNTKVLLKRCLDSIFNQTYQNFMIYLIGDKYEFPDEIGELLKEYDKDKITFINLEIAKERDLYYNNKWALWSYGGVNAINYGIDKSLYDGYNYICHLDHDDYWDKKHLENINDCIKLTNSSWICTKSYYINNYILPNINSSEKYIDFKPKKESLIHSSVCVDFNKIPLRYRDIFSETGYVGLPADAELWERCREFIEKNNLKSTLINEITCYHIEEGYVRK